MGLFGYGERDYVKNSTIFKDQLTNILYEVGRFETSRRKNGGLVLKTF